MGLTGLVRDGVDGLVWAWTWAGMGSTRLGNGTAWIGPLAGLDMLIWAMDWAGPWAGLGHWPGWTALGCGLWWSVPWAVIGWAILGHGLG
jgi:hypothetical protein